MVWFTWSHNDIGLWLRSIYKCSPACYASVMYFYCLYFLLKGRTHITVTEERNWCASWWSSTSAERNHRNLVRWTTHQGRNLGSATTFTLVDKVYWVSYLKNSFDFRHYLQQKHLLWGWTCLQELYCSPVQWNLMARTSDGYCIRAILSKIKIILSSDFCCWFVSP